MITLLILANVGAWFLWYKKPKDEDWDDYFMGGKYGSDLTGAALLVAYLSVLFVDFICVCSIVVEVLP